MYKMIQNGPKWYNMLDICFFYFVLTALWWFFSKRWIDHFEDTKALWWITSYIPSNLIIHLVGKYQLHQHKDVCYRQGATHPMTACLGGANVLRKQELGLEVFFFLTFNLVFTHKRKFRNNTSRFNYNKPKNQLVAIHTQDGERLSYF